MKPALPSSMTTHALSLLVLMAYRIWYYLFVLPTSFLLVTPILGFSSYVLSYFNGRLAVFMGVLWGRYILWAARVKAKVIGEEHIDKKQSYVIVVNHESNLDIIGIYGYLPVDFRWVMKIEIRKIPILGPVCERMEHVYVDRSNREKAIESLRRAKARLVNGTSILFFPEGTRSNKPEMLPFKKGAFRMALDLQLPILPVTLRNTGVLMPSRSMESRPGTIELVIHKPISVKNLTSDDIPALMEQAYNVIDSVRVRVDT